MRVSSHTGSSVFFRLCTDGAHVRQATHAFGWHSGSPPSDAPARSKVLEPAGRVLGPAGWSW
eukprot:3502726-Prymnesium_polylepis.1